MINIKSIANNYRTLIKQIKITDNLAEMMNFINFMYCDRKYVKEVIDLNTILISIEGDDDFTCTMTYDSLDDIYELYSWMRVDLNTALGWCAYTLDSKFNDMSPMNGLKEYDYCFLSLDDAIDRTEVETEYMYDVDESDQIIVCTPRYGTGPGIWIYNHVGVWRIIFYDRRIWNKERLIYAFID